MPEESHHNCLLCGDQNPRSLGLQFKPHAEDSVQAEFQGHKELQGYDGILHGGIIASLLDSAMTHCLFEKGIRAVTGDLQVRYKHSIPYDAKIIIQANITESHPPLYRLKSRILLNNKTMVRGEARFMKIPEQKKHEHIISNPSDSGR